LLTGGTGFVGRALLRAWLAAVSAGRAVPEVTVLTRSSRAFLERFPEFADLWWLRFHIGDVCAPESLPTGQSFSHILHMAADSTMGPQLTPLQRFGQIVYGTRNLLELGAATGVSRFVLTSSGAIYGPQPASVDRLAEDWPGSPDVLAPGNAYALAKRAAEHLCMLYQQSCGIEVVIARCFAFVGRDLPLDVHFAIGNFIRDALGSESIRVSGDGTPIRTYLDQEDLAHWLLTMLERGQNGEAYNVGSDEIITIGALAHLVRDLLAPGKRVDVLGGGGGSQGRNRYVPDITKAREGLGLTVRIPLAEAIRRAAAPHRAEAVSNPR
jgi:dTDP-glucose 4,6-dehydratase